MTVAELSRLLTGRPGAPEPSLVGWLARHAAPADWDLVLRAVARYGRLEPPEGWPVVRAAVDEIARTRGLDRPVAPPPPRLGDRDPGELTEEEAAWLLPEAAEQWHADLRRSALSGLERTLLAGQDWYAALLVAHLAPYLGSQRGRAGRLVARHAGDFWRSHLTALLGRDAPAGSAAAELDLSHPAVAGLDRAARNVPDADLRALCRRMLSALLYRTDRGSNESAGPDLRPGSLTEPLGEEPARRPALWVNNGLADPVERRARPVGRGLRTGADYLFWFEISDTPDPDSAERDPAEFRLPDEATAGARLQVTLSTLPDELAVRPGQETGELVVGAGGEVLVARQPDGSAPSGRRLFFPIRTPAAPGRHRLRCSLHHKGRLLQSRTLSAMVGPAEREQAWAVETTVDYLSGQALDPGALGAMKPIDLSIMVDDREPTGGQTGLVIAQGAEVASIGMSSQALAQQVERCRAALRTASYSNSRLPEPGEFHYDDYPGAPPVPPEKFRRDLELIARRGSDAWVELGSRIAETFRRTGRSHLLSEAGPPGYEHIPLWRLSTWLRRPRVIELANTADLQVLVPATMIYDRPLALRGPLRICDAFQAALAAHTGLTTVECFRGDCPNDGVEEVICPSGFWGFRHELGSPQSIGQTGGADASRDVPLRELTITYSGRPRCAVGRAGDFGRDHPEWVSRLGDGALKVRTDAVNLLGDLRRRDPEPHLVYFYCHGDFSYGMPMLHFDAAGRDLIAATDLASRVSWPNSRPLVFLNACRSIATQPEHASNFIDALVRWAGASGIVGTEIITYERLAAAFAEQVLTEFVLHRRPLGEAMRTARLALLSRGNPLGLIYTAYAPPHLDMRAA
ncbi:CHAT domain-containing protein [Actinoplanes sp. NPDC049118]|uniref:CHAT domain-containing protein n=1 Tax=Actinoplanes sp. NPDC049118 TaxID=3155769 RepID=UPI0033F418DB